MKQILLIILFLPLLLVSQTQPKPKTSTPAKKPGTTTTAKKPTGTTAKKPAGTTAKKTTTTTAKKPSPQVVKLTEKAYELYNESKDAECEKVVKQILALDPKNKDAFMLRANIAMFEFKYDEMWNNLDKVYKYYPNEPEVYSNFAMTHLNYYFLNDSAKRVLCRKTIRLASRNAEGYAALGMVAAVGGNYAEALTYFDICSNLNWKDTLSRVVMDLPYANCLYSTGDTLGAIDRLNKIIPRMGGRDKYTCIYLRTKYMLELKDLNVTADLDTLNAYAPNQPDVLVLNVQYLSLINNRDSACKLSKIIRMAQNGEMFDMSPYCDDIVKTVDINRTKKLTYSMGSTDYIVNMEEFAFPDYSRFTWQSGPTNDKSKWKSGKVYIRRAAMDSSYLKTFSFEHESDVTLDKAGSFWLSSLQLKDINKDSTTRLNINGSPMNGFKMIGHEQIEVYDAGNNDVLLDCLILTDGTNKICYLNDPVNPLIVKFESEKTNFVLVKIE